MSVVAHPVCVVKWKMLMANTYTLYGTVKFFFTYTYEDIEYKLAFLEEYKVEKDDLLLYISSGCRTFHVISIIAIKELVGILISKGR